ncbi:DNA-binding HxlR family transcriptional regulator [Gracilibacillus halotolerans]|uniref:DNA-binding HxlR family transcriptional regulator n=1 Tax=Gracilibacillus halotolerans TaxID=74386 RepID=A0A841RV60_9BACI|nr:helix-turn-helix domain-containing protein [Gracilibacillus halotolerans]MBB6514348.1 DNA-binding HxlR family transcriptional regulator [Gracilibacillus halotolerans]
MSDKTICPKFEAALDILNKRWTGLIIFELLDGAKRFSAIESAIGISGRVLSERLKDLEKQGIVKREVYNETPVRIEYHLTDKGYALEPVLNSIQQWADGWMKMNNSQ